MPLNTAAIIRSPANVTFNGGTFQTEGEWQIRPVRARNDVNTSIYGRVGRVLTARHFEVSGRLWGAWEHLGVLFPDALINPVIGAPYFGNSNIPLVLTCKNSPNDRWTFFNARVTRMPTLHIGVDAPIFSGEVVFTCILDRTKNPGDADGYFTHVTGATFSDTLNRNAYRQACSSAAWGTAGTFVPGFTTFETERGWDISFNPQLEAKTADCYGLYDFLVEDSNVEASCIPIGPAPAQVEATSPQTLPLGSLDPDAFIKNLVITSTNPALSVVINNMVLDDYSFRFDRGEQIVGPCTWRNLAPLSGTTRVTLT